MNIVQVSILKPVYGTFVYIRDEILRDAIRRHALLEIKIPQGSGVVDPKEWIKNGKRMEKVFKIPTKPMVLWGGSVPIRVPQGVVEPKDDKTARLF